MDAQSYATTADVGFQMLYYALEYVPHFVYIAVLIGLLFALVAFRRQDKTKFVEIQKVWFIIVIFFKDLSLGQILKLIV